MPDRFDEVMRILDSLSDKFDEMKDQLGEIADKVSDLEYRSLTPDEKAQREFDAAQDINVQELSSVPAGDILEFITTSYFYPSEEPVVETFEYRHGEVVHAETTKWGTVVLGSSRLTEDAEWTPYRFYATDKESTTSDCTGTIRRRP